MASKRLWLAQEDRALFDAVQKHGAQNWTTIAKYLDSRSAKQCRERWYHHVDPRIVKGHWTEEEDALIIRMVAEIGRKWSTIARCLQGRTDNSVKNRHDGYLRARNTGNKGAGDDFKRPFASSQAGRQQAAAEAEEGIRGRGPKKKSPKRRATPASTPSIATAVVLPAHHQSSNGDSAKRRAKVEGEPQDPIALLREASIIADSPETEVRLYDSIPEAPPSPGQLLPSLDNSLRKFVPKAPDRLPHWAEKKADKTTVKLTPESTERAFETVLRNLGSGGVVLPAAGMRGTGVDLSPAITQVHHIPRYRSGSSTPGTSPGSSPAGSPGSPAPGGPNPQFAGRRGLPAHRDRSVLATGGQQSSLALHFTHSSLGIPRDAGARMGVQTTRVDPATSTSSLRGQLTTSAASRYVLTLPDGKNDSPPLTIRGQQQSKNGQSGPTAPKQPRRMAWPAADYKSMSSLSAPVVYRSPLAEEAEAKAKMVEAKAKMVEAKAQEATAKPS